MSRASRYGSAPDLAWVDDCIERARIATARRLSSPWFRRLCKGKARFRERPRMSRRDAFEEMRRARFERTHRRRHHARAPLASQSWSEHAQLLRTIDEGYAWAETRATTEVIHARVRYQMASALDRLASSSAATQEPSWYSSRAERLRKSRKRGTWGYHHQTRVWRMFFDDRSGLVRFDPSEARRDQSRQIQRLKPELQAHAKRGMHIYAGVFTEPNAPVGELAAAKRAQIERFKRAILGYEVNGSRRRDGGAFPEIVGAYLIQEDPLSARGDWNVHVNVLLVVDPKLCTPLDPELELALPPGPRPKGRTPRGLLCYKKLHYVWGHQLRFRKVEARSDAALEKAIVEAIKYPAKWVSAKGLPAAGDSDQSSGGADLPGVVLSPVRAGGEAGPGGGSSGTGSAPGCDRGRPRPGPPIIEWPLERLSEWIDANHRFRRARGFGCLYRLAKAPPDDDERDHRIIGEVLIEPHGALVTVTHAETPKAAPVNLIHGDKSVLAPWGFDRSRLGAPARAGPPTAAVPP